MLNLRSITISLVLITGVCTATPAVVEKATLAVSMSGELVESIGIQTLGGVFTPLLSHGCRIPCSTAKIFSTADDRQTEIKLFLFRGNEKMADKNKGLGQFIITGIPPELRGQPQVEVTFSVQKNDLTISAKDKKTNLPLKVKRREF